MMPPPDGEPPKLSVEDARSERRALARCAPAAGAGDAVGARAPACPASVELGIVLELRPVALAGGPRSSADCRVVFSSRSCTSALHCTCCAEAATEACNIFEAPENAAKVSTVQKECAGDLGKFFMMMIPLATQLVGSVIEKYGFEANQQGAMAFVGELQKHQGDSEIKALVRPPR
jgi:hypothetical protein